MYRWDHDITYDSSRMPVMDIPTHVLNVKQIDLTSKNAWADENYGFALQVYKKISLKLIYCLI